MTNRPLASVIASRTCRSVSALICLQLRTHFKTEENVCTPLRGFTAQGEMTSVTECYRPFRRAHTGELDWDLLSFQAASPFGVFPASPVRRRMRPGSVCAFLCWTLLDSSLLRPQPSGCRSANAMALRYGHSPSGFFRENLHALCSPALKSLLPSLFI